MLCGFGSSDIFNHEFAKVLRTGHITKTKMNGFLYNIAANSFYYHICL